MKYTRTESGVIEVKGCTSCPHMEMREEYDDSSNPAKPAIKTMFCMALQLYYGGKWRPRNRKLLTQWTGPYHATCPLASDPKMVPELPKEVKK